MELYYNACIRFNQQSVNICRFNEVIFINKKNNRRRKESIRKIEAAFTELLQHSELEKISVSDICKAAGINRSTFYSNFLDIYDLAENMKKSLLEETMNLYKDEQLNGTRNHDFSKLFEHIYANRIFYKTYFKLGNLRWDSIGFDREAAEKYYNMEHIDYHIEFFQAGFNAILKKWLDGDCAESPEEMCRILKNEYSQKM